MVDLKGLNHENHRKHVRTAGKMVEIWDYLFTNTSVKRSHQTNLLLQGKCEENKMI
jgi:hypothetical protein